VLIKVHEIEKEHLSLIRQLGKKVAR
jgi:hypothetical protein